MKPDLYIEWINNEVLEKGFQEPLWSIAKKEVDGNEILAKEIYVQKRKEQLIAQDFKLPVFEGEGTLTRVPRRPPPEPGFVERNPQVVKTAGLVFAGTLIFLGLYMAKKYGLK